MKFSFALAILTQAVNIAAATTTPKDCSNTNEWDAVVVGAGLSGSIIASKLATDAPDKCVLVVEGGKESGQIIDAEDASVVKSNNEFFEKGWGAVHTSPETVWNTPGAYDNGNFVCYGQDCDYVWGKDGTNTPGGLVAGKVVGGSGAINGALMQYPPDNNWEPYPDGWKAGDMKKYLDEIHSTMNASVSYANNVLPNLWLDYDE
jgi:choline dehydrogenase-like flavoprotein